MAFSRVKHSAKKAGKFRQEHYSAPKRVNVHIDVRRVRQSGTYPQPPYFAEACFRDPRGGAFRHAKFDRCADGRGASPTKAIAQAMKRLASVVK